MNKGTYFYKCTETSVREKQVFRYRYLENTSSSSGAIGKNHNPFFLMISHNSIVFYEDGKYAPVFTIPLYPKGTGLDNLTQHIIDFCDENPIEFNNAYRRNDSIINDNPFVFHKDDLVENKDKLPYWCIFEHFLFDVLHSDVFQNADHYEEAIIKLTDNYFVNCIIAKAEYSYWFAQFKGNENDKYVLDKIWQADKKWISMIIDESENQVLEVSKNWFNGAEVELRKALQINYKIEESATHMFLAKFIKLFTEFLKRMLNHRKINDRQSFINNFYEKNSTNISEIAKIRIQRNKLKEIKIQRDNIYHFFLSRFSTWSIENYILSYNKIEYAYAFKFLISLLSGLFFFFNISLFFIFLGVLLIYRLILLPFYKKRVFRIFIKMKNPAIIFFNFPLFSKKALVYMLLLGSMLLVLVNYWIVFAILCFCVLGINQTIIKPLIFIKQEINNRKGFINFYNHSIGYPKMSLAIIAIWLGYIPICEEAWQLNNTFENFMFLIYFIIFWIIVLSSILYFVNISNHEFSLLRGLRKSFALIIKGMSISIAFGIFAMEMSRENMFLKPSDFFPKKDNIEFLKLMSNISEKKENRYAIINNIEKINSYQLLNKIPGKEDVIEMSKIKADLEKIEALKIDFLIEMARIEANELCNIPSITVFKLKQNTFQMNFFIFPKLLLMYSSFAFFIGLFAQVAFSGSNYKENL